MVHYIALQVYLYLLSFTLYLAAFFNFLNLSLKTSKISKLSKLSKLEVSVSFCEKNWNHRKIFQRTLNDIRKINSNIENRLIQLFTDRYF